MKSKLFIWLIAVVLISGMEVYAHHSFAGTYLLDKEKIKKIEGRLVQVMFRNPHSFFHVEVVSENGEKTKYAIESQGATAARGYGGKRPLKVGDHVIVTGNPARLAESNRMRMVTIIRPEDGWSWGTGTGEVVD